jgi:capsular exopolysaccharide synthesis family protein
MSRISQALRVLAGNNSDDAATEPVTSSMQQYEREERQLQPRPLEPVPRVRVPEPESPSDQPRDRRPADAATEARLVTGTSSTVSIEQYRRLAATLHDTQATGQLKTVMITSALPGDGKTLTVANLALTLSESYGRRVLVIDADLRAPSMHHVFGVPNDRGLGEALRGEAEPSFVRVAEGLTVLPAGTPGPAPLAGLTSARMARILDECASRFDWVLIDTPPIGVLPDAQVLARLADAVLFVVGAGSTPVAAVERAIAELGGPEGIFGLVLNRVEEQRIPAASYYGHYTARPAK